MSTFISVDDEPRTLQVVQMKAETYTCSDPLPGTPLKLIVANEFAERFCFYGTRSLLVLFLTDRLHFSEANAVTTYSLYLAGCYLSPLLGGYVSDGELWVSRC